MTKTQALHKFMSGFELDAYPSNAVPVDDRTGNRVEPPYLTYSKGFSKDGYSATIHLYFKTESENIPDNKAEEICNALRNGGVQIPCDGGQLWIALENPEWYPANEEADHTIKHRVINISINDFTL